MAAPPENGRAAPRLLIIAAGNPYRRDDGVGIAIARRLQDAVKGNPGIVAVREESGEGTALLEAWRGAERAILLDAVSSGAEAGTVFRLDATAQPIPVRFFRYSTHAFSVAEAIELGRSLGELPRSLLVYGVEGADFEAGEGLSAPVEQAVARVVDAVLAEIGSATVIHQE